MYGYPTAPASLPAFPGPEFFLRQRLEEAVGDDDLSLEDIGLPLARGLAGNEPYDRFTATSDNDFFTRFDLCQQSGKLRLGNGFFLTVISYRPIMDLI